ncbi:MAG TPA: hypothetical protein VK843_08630 [Planctomycetota bacterium]|nr:hypothetical protein [Planctomycetota bacterium]
MQYAVQCARSLLGSVTALLAFAGIANATTWIVDINNGAGANFLQIRDAVVASQPGDVIIVRPGAYSPLSGAYAINKGITIIGQGTVTVGILGINDVDIRNLPAGETVVAVNLTVRGWWITTCLGSVTIRESKCRSTTVQQCADVRIQSMAAIIGQVSVSNSRVEIANTTIQGDSGNDGQSCNSWWPATNGMTGLSVDGGSVVHLVRSSVFGGHGGSNSIPGDGGLGVSAYNSELWIDGGGVSTIQGGYGGWSDGCTTNWDGDNGHGVLMNGGRLIRSGVTLLPTPPQGNGAAGHPLMLLGGAIDQPVTPDSPTLELARDPLPGGGVLFTIHAPPGSVVRLNLGSQPQVLATPGIQVQNLLVKSQSFDLGITPPQGVVMKRFSISPLALPGDRLFSQAQIVMPSIAQVRRTASALVVVR